MHLSRQQQRRSAAVLLLLWWFGIGAGFANACHSESQRPLIVGNHVASTLQAFLHGVPAPAASVGHGSHDRDPAQHPQGQVKGHDNKNCQDFCDKVSLAVPVAKSVLDDGGAAAAAPPSASTCCHPNPNSTVDRVESWVPRPLGNIDPPIRIVLQRLAL